MNVFAENGKISIRQLQVLLLLDCFGTALLFLPAELSQISERGSWICAWMGGLVFVLTAGLLMYTAGKMPEGTVVVWCRRCFGYVFGTVVLFGLWAKVFFDGMIELRLFSEILCRTMLPTTPVWAITLILLLVAGGLAVQGMECRGRCAEILFFVVLVPLGIVLLAVAVSAEYNRVLPIEIPSFRETVDGVSAMSLLFQGLTFLYFVSPALRKKEKSCSAVVISSLITVCIATVIVFLCIAVYGEGVVSGKLLPTLQMMERVSFTGVFLTRQDVALLWFWMAANAIFLSGTIFYATVLGVQIFRQREQKRKQWMAVSLLILFLLSFLPEDLSMAYRLRLQISPILQILFLIGLPLALLFFRRGGRADD